MSPGRCNCGRKVQDQMRLLVVIVSYKVTDLTLQCLRSLSGEVPGLPGVHVSVCENGTGGDAEERIRRAVAEEGWGDWIDVRAVYPNRGFTGGNNVVLRDAMDSDSPPEYLLLLNADTVVRPGAMRALVRFMDAHPEVGVAGSRIENPNGSWQCSPFRNQTFVSELDRGLRLGFVTRLLSRWTVSPPEPTEESQVDWVSGASMIIRREVLQQVGLLDEGLYTYFDDIDFCMRARRAGWQVWYVPTSRVTHLGGQSTGIGQAEKRPQRRPPYWFLARRRFFLKQYGAAYTALADAAFLTGFALWRLRRFIQRKPDTDPPYMLWDSFRHSVFCTGFKIKPVPNPAMELGEAQHAGATQQQIGTCTHD